MKLLIATVVIQILLMMFSYVQFCRIKKHKEKVLFYHETKSFIDTYSSIVRCTFLNIILVCIASFIKKFCRQEKIAFVSADIYAITSGAIVVFLVLILTMAFALYMTTEIKHLSSDDAIGEKLQKLEIQEQKKAYRFYVTEVIVGLTLELTLVIQAFCLHVIIGIVFVFGTIFLYFFGMADVLQHDSYNAEGYKVEYKKKPFLDRMYITNIIGFYLDKEYQKKSLNILQENTKNIKKGICIFLDRLFGALK